MLCVMLEISQFSCVYMGRTQFIPSNETHLCSVAAAFDLCIIAIIMNANDGPSFVLVLACTVLDAC